MTAKSYDVKCFDLADQVMEHRGALGTQQNTCELAGRIQETIDEFLDEIEQKQKASR